MRRIGSEPKVGGFDFYRPGGFNGGLKEFSAHTAWDFYQMPVADIGCTSIRDNWCWNLPPNYRESTQCHLINLVYLNRFAAR